MVILLIIIIILLIISINYYQYNLVCSLWAKSVVPFQKYWPIMLLFPQLQKHYQINK